MEQLLKISNLLVSRTSLHFMRYLYHKIDWNNRLIAIVGPRGVGKTTLILQYMKQRYSPDSGEALYVSLDNLWFSTHTLLEFADDFHTNGGKALFLDEVHKYPGWSKEIKNIYDSYPDMKVVFTGSSMLDIFRSGGDLSRRALKYTLCGMSLREYLEYEHNVKVTPLTLEELLSKHVSIATKLGNSIKPIVVFKEYLKHGYFPFYKEDREAYLQRLSETVTTIIEVDLPANLDIEYQTVLKIKKLFSIIAAMVPFTPNITQLATQVGTTRSSLLSYLDALARAQAILLLDKQAKGLKRLAKPEKIYLSNPNYIYAFAGDQSNIGNIRETFFHSMLQVAHQVNYSDKTDFLIDDKYSFEIGGKDKSQSQIAGIPDSFVAKDNIETGFRNQIPLWMFGLLY